MRWMDGKHTHTHTHATKEKRLRLFERGKETSFGMLFRFGAHPSLSLSKSTASAAAHNIWTASQAQALVQCKFTRRRRERVELDSASTPPHCTALDGTPLWEFCSGALLEPSLFPSVERILSWHLLQSHHLVKEIHDIVDSMITKTKGPRLDGSSRDQIDESKGEKYHGLGFALNNACSRKDWSCLLTFSKSRKACFHFPAFTFTHE